MSRGRTRGRRRGGHDKHEESNERWLLTYADMITLLMALFMVLFSISSVNVSKYTVLEHSLKAAFSGSVLPGGKSIAEQGATQNARKAPATADAAAIVPLTAIGSGTESAPTTRRVESTVNSAHGTHSAANTQTMTVQQEAAAHETSEFQRIKHELDAYARSHGFSKSVKTTIEHRGLVIRVLTDDLLFASGQATLNSRAYGLLREIGQLLNVDSVHPIGVEGHTDNVPIHSAQFPSNWELSTARASTVVQYLAGHGVSSYRLSATGYADQKPISSNATAAGRQRNRRVEIVLRRLGSNSGQ
jgi:chemotaxis protein MotB